MIELTDGWKMYLVTVLSKDYAYLFHNDCTTSAPALTYMRDIPRNQMLSKCRFCEKEIPEKIKQAVYSIYFLSKIK